ncbi:hypothetical protein [Flavobacterium rhizosphaerae]|uniref:Uncharacterized protein n=1 Tax=Flavobacterium rhizosphaerae TaxID=3163298 RepID=A0ABW8YXJ8_9FLAO
MKVFNSSFPLLHYKYSKRYLEEVSVENRKERNFYHLFKKLSVANMYLVARNKDNILRNAKFTGKYDHSSRKNKIHSTLYEESYYIKLDFSLTGPGSYWAICDMVLTADEYKLENRMENFTSDLLTIGTNHFSIILPVDHNTELEGTDAELTLILQGQVLTYNPYTFESDQYLQKINVLSLPDNKIEILYTLL